MKWTAEMQAAYRTLLKNTRIPHTAYHDARKELDKAFLKLGTTSFPQCRQLSGVSRSGKSLLVRDFQTQSPSQRLQEGLISTIVYACIPPKGTVLGLLENLLYAMGDPYWERGSESRKLARLITLMEKSQCKAIVLDEFQHLVDKGQNRVLKLTIDFIKSLIEPNKWFLIVSGLPNANRIIEQDPQLRNRFPPALTLPRFDWFDEDLQGEFMGILNAFAQALHPFDLPELGCEEVAMRFYLATGGLIGLVTKILQRAVEDAVDDRRHTIRLQHLGDAFQQEIRFADHYGAINPFHMKVDAPSVGQRLKEASTLVEPDDDDGHVTQAKVHVQSVTNRKKVTKAAHKQAMAGAL